MPWSGGVSDCSDPTPLLPRMRRGVGYRPIFQESLRIILGILLDYLRTKPPSTVTENGNPNLLQFTRTSDISTSLIQIGYLIEEAISLRREKCLIVRRIWFDKKWLCGAPDYVKVSLLPHITKRIHFV